MVFALLFLGSTQQKIYKRIYWEVKDIKKFFKNILL
jgi:hypothetical protein